MTSTELMELVETSELAQGLRALREERAPATLIPGTLARLGLADEYAVIDSPIGPLFIAWNGLGISAVEPAGDPAAFERAHLARFGRTAYSARALPAPLARAVTRRLAGTGGPPPFDLRGRSEFEQAVLNQALRIPRGEVRPYSWVAREIGRPGAVRAVGSALGRNPVPLLIPCHRVVRSDGRLGEYGLGPERKRVLLAAEGLDPDGYEQMAVEGVRFHGSDTTRIYCYPTCRCARRVMDRHRVTFRSGAEAERAGYRPCRICRPAA